MSSNLDREYGSQDLSQHSETGDQLHPPRHEAHIFSTLLDGAVTESLSCRDHPGLTHCCELESNQVTDLRNKKDPGSRPPLQSGINRSIFRSTLEYFTKNYPERDPGMRDGKKMFEELMKR